MKSGTSGERIVKNSVVKTGGGMFWFRGGLFGVAILVNPIHALNFSDLRTNTRVLISDSGTATSRLRFTNSEINTFLNECQRESVAASWPIVKTTNIELAAGTTYYSIPNTALAVKRVTWRNRVLTERSIANLDGTKEWETISGTPQNYFVTFASRTFIGIYPFPADSTSTGTVKVDFFAQADDLAADADIPYNGIREFYPMHHILSYCAAARMAAIDGQTGVAGLYLQIYNQLLGRLAAIALSRPSYSPSVTPGNPGGP